MSNSEHDTLDIKEELGDIDEVLATGSLTVAAESRRTGAVELALVSIANVIWAVAGPVLWLPRATRAVLWTALRTIHSALTDQSSGRAVAGIKEVSRSYIERFVHRQKEQEWVGRRHELRPFRLVAETVWTVTFYLVVLRWLAPDRFRPLWQRLAEWASAARVAGLSAATQTKTWLVGLIGSFDGTRLQIVGGVLFVSFVGVALGFWLGRRGR